MIFLDLKKDNIEKTKMASNIVYVSAVGNDNTAQIGNPTKPFTFQGAMNLVNNGGQDKILLLSNGLYSLGSCTENFVIRNNVSIIGTGPKNVILESVNISVGSEVTNISFNNLTLNGCSTSNQTLLTINGGIVSLNNCEVKVLDGPFISLNNGGLKINTCNVDINPGINNPIIDGSNGILICSNSNFVVNFTNPLQDNVSIFGVKPGTGFTNLYNITLFVKLNGGNYTIIPFYNINSVINSTVIITGTGTESLILIGVDILPGSVISELPIGPQGSQGPIPNQLTLFAINLSAVPRNLANVYSNYNLNDYPLVMQNIQWGNSPTTPGSYIRPTPQPVQMPPPITPSNIPAPTIPPVVPTIPGPTIPNIPGPTIPNIPGPQIHKPQIPSAPGTTIPGPTTPGVPRPPGIIKPTGECDSCAVPNLYGRQPVETFYYGNPIRFPIYSGDDEISLVGEENFIEL